jgi:hypothetical protein
MMKNHVVKLGMILSILVGYIIPTFAQGSGGSSHPASSLPQMTGSASSGPITVKKGATAMYVFTQTDKDTIAGFGTPVLFIDESCDIVPVYNTGNTHSRSLRNVDEDGKYIYDCTTDTTNMTVGIYSIAWTPFNSCRTSDIYRDTLLQVSQGIVVTN